MAKKSEKLIGVVRELRKQPGNKTCFDCNDKGPQNVCLNFSTFVCMTCSGIHRESPFNHRVKSMAVSDFTEEEADALKHGGNEAAAKYWLARWDPSDFPIPDSSLPPAIRSQRLKEFFKMKYLEKRWIPREPAKKREEAARDNGAGKDRRKVKQEDPPIKHLSEVLPDVGRLVVTRSNGDSFQNEDGDEEERKRKKKEKWAREKQKEKERQRDAGSKPKEVKQEPEKPHSPIDLLSFEGGQSKPKDSEDWADFDGGAPAKEARAPHQGFIDFSGATPAPSKPEAKAAKPAAPQNHIDDPFADLVGGSRQEAPSSQGGSQLNVSAHSAAPGLAPGAPVMPGLSPLGPGMPGVPLGPGLAPGPGPMGPVMSPMPSPYMLPAQQQAYLAQAQAAAYQQMMYQQMIYQQQLQQLYRQGGYPPAQAPPQPAQAPPKNPPKPSAGSAFDSLFDS